MGFNFQEKNVKLMCHVATQLKIVICHMLKIRILLFGNKYNMFLRYIPSSEWQG